jgi:hypothetical protein
MVRNENKSKNKKKELLIQFFTSWTCSSLLCLKLIFAATFALDSFKL